MSDSTSPLEQVVAGTGAVPQVNGNFDAASPAMLYGRDSRTTNGLTWGYLGGRLNSLAVANGTVTLAASATNYIVALRSSGAVSVSSSITNWNDTTNYLRLYLVTTGTTTPSSYQDHRAAIGGAGGGGGSRTPSVQSVVSAATVTPTFSDDAVKITAQAAALALANPTGTAIDMLGIVVRIKDDGTARAITYGSQYRAIGVTLPVTTVVGKTVYLAMIFNTEDTKWDVVAVGQEA